MEKQVKRARLRPGYEMVLMTAAGVVAGVVALIQVLIIVTVASIALEDCAPVAEPSVREIVQPKHFDYRFDLPIKSAPQ